MRNKELVQIPRVTLKLAYQAMMYVVREEAEEGEVDEKFEELADALLRNEDLDLTNLVDNLEVVYNALKEEYTNDFLEGEEN